MDNLNQDNSALSMLSLSELASLNNQSVAVFTQPLRPVIGMDNRGCLFNDYLVSTFSALSEKPELVKRLFGAKTPENSNQFKVGVCILGNWTTIQIDDSFPCYTNPKTKEKVMVGSNTSINNLWPLLLEKAYSAVLGSYLQAGVGGDPCNVLTDLTGAPTERFKLYEFFGEVGDVLGENGANYGYNISGLSFSKNEIRSFSFGSDQEKLFNFLKYSIKQRPDSTLLAISEDPDEIKDQSQYEFDLWNDDPKNRRKSLSAFVLEVYGIRASSTFSVIQVLKIDNAKVVKLRDYTNLSRWAGSWEEGGDELKNKLQMGTEDGLEGPEGGLRPGEFWIPFDKFCLFFESVLVNYFDSRQVQTQMILVSSSDEARDEVIMLKMEVWKAGDYSVMLSQRDANFRQINGKILCFEKILT